MTSNNGGIRIAVLCGSVRPDNYTRMAVDVVTASLSTHPDISVDIVDPSELDLPLPGLGRDLHFRFGPSGSSTRCHRGDPFHACIPRQLFQRDEAHSGLDFPGGENVKWG